ncbi:hypothetical protein V6Z11_A03G103000 [Gossypium hirsutum]
MLVRFAILLLKLLLQILTDCQAAKASWNKVVRNNVSHKLFNSFPNDWVIWNVQNKLQVQFADRLAKHTYIVQVQDAYVQH